LKQVGVFARRPLGLKLSFPSTPWLLGKAFARTEAAQPPDLALRGKEVGKKVQGPKEE